MQTPVFCTQGYKGPALPLMLETNLTQVGTLLQHPPPTHKCDSKNTICTKSEVKLVWEVEKVDEFYCVLLSAFLD